MQSGSEERDDAYHAGLDGDLKGNDFESPNLRGDLADPTNKAAQLFGRLVVGSQQVGGEHEGVSGQGAGDDTSVVLQAAMCAALENPMP